MRPTVSGSTGVQALPDLTIAGPYPWKYNITTTVFWIGEQASPQHPISNEKSAWDPDWVSRYRTTTLTIASPNRKRRS